MMMSTYAMAAGRRRVLFLMAVALVTVVLAATVGHARGDDESAEAEVTAVTAQAEVRTLSTSSEATGQLVRSDVSTVGHGGTVSVGAQAPGGAPGAQAPATASEVALDAASFGGVFTSALSLGTAPELVLVATQLVSPAPTQEPTEALTEEPTQEPTPAPTEEPTQEPTPAPTEEPTQEPTPAPTEEPTPAPTEEPTEAGGLLVEPAALDFGTVAVGEVTIASVAVTNAWQDTILVGAQLLGQGRFSVENLDEPVALAPGETLRIAVAFAPDQPGGQVAELVLTVDDAVTATIPLTGVGAGEEPGDPTAPDPASPAPAAPDPASPAPAAPGAGQDRSGGGAPAGGTGGSVGGAAPQGQSSSASLGVGAATEMPEGQNSATLTWLLERGAPVEAGTILYTANAEPVAAVIGSTPIWRTLERDVAGEDVTMLQDNLVALGYLDAEHTAGTFDATTEAAVEAWETELGREEPDGRVARGEVVVLAGPGTVIEHRARTGDDLAPATPVLTVGTAPDSVTLDVAVDDLATWPVGTTVEVSWTDGGTAAGSVVAIGTEAEGSGSAATVAVTVALDAPTPTRPEGAAVTATTTDLRDAALAVPVTAVVAGADGEPAVRLADGPGSTLVPVTLGLVDGGWIQIHSGLDEGQTVHLPGSTTLP